MRDTGLYRVIVVNRIQYGFIPMSVIRRSPTSTVSSGSGTGVAAIGTISGSGRTATLFGLLLVAGSPTEVPEPPRKNSIR